MSMIIPQTKKKISDMPEKFAEIKCFLLFIYAPLLYYSANEGMFIPDYYFAAG